MQNPQQAIDSGHGAHRRRRRRSRREQPPASPRPTTFGLGDALLPFNCFASVIVALCIVLGGGGTQNPLTEMLLEGAVAIGILLVAIVPALSRGARPIPATAWALVVLALVVPLGQLIPLPPAVWHELPNRAIEVRALALVGADQAWMPLSVDPAATLAALLSAIAIAGVYLIAVRLDKTGRVMVCATVVALAAVSMVLGAFQISHFAGRDWSLYSEYHQGWLIGFHSNRNAETETLQIAMLAVGVLATWAVTRRKLRISPGPISALIIFVLTVGTIMTGSRAGVLLLPVTFAWLVVLLAPVLRWSVRAVFVRSAMALVLLAAVGTAVTYVPAVQRVAERFHLGDEARTGVWADTVYLIRQTWPVGGGVGSFAALYPTAERLETLEPQNWVRAHNDWLEWALEAGLPGMVVLATILGLLAFHAVQSYRRVSGRRVDPLRRAEILFAGGVLTHIGLHAIVDFPMRVMTLNALCAIAAAFLTTVPESEPVEMAAAPAEKG